MRSPVWLSSVVCAAWTFLTWLPAGKADEDSKKICASAYASAQRLMRAGNLLEAKTKLVLCGGPECPAVMHPDCEEWLSSVEASIATVVFEVTAGAQRVPNEVHVSVDGQDQGTVASRTVSLDPGIHDVTFVANGFRTTTKHIVVSAGEKLRREEVSLEPLSVARRIEEPTLPPQAIPARSHAVDVHPSRWTAPIIIATSGAALASIGAIYFGVKARSDDRALDDCAPSGSCSRAATDQVRHEYLWTNLSIGVAAAAITTAAVLFVVGGSSTKASTTSLSVGVGPNAFGSVASGTF